MINSEEQGGPVKLSKVRGEVYHFRKAPLQFQQTFATPLKDLPRFVATILSPLQLEEARVTIDQVVFDPEHLLELLKNHSISVESCRDSTVLASGQEEISALLEASLGDWVDFLFVPTPKHFVIYADHDEWTTIFAENESELRLIGRTLSTSGFREIPNYVRF